MTSNSIISPQMLKDLCNSLKNICKADANSAVGKAILTLACPDCGRIFSTPFLLKIHIDYALELNLCNGRANKELKDSHDLNDKKSLTSDDLIEHVYTFPLTHTCICVDQPIPELTKEEDQISLLSAFQSEEEQLIIIHHEKHQYVTRLSKCAEGDLYGARQLTLGQKEYMVTVM